MEKEEEKCMLSVFFSLFFHFFSQIEKIEKNFLYFVENIFDNRRKV